MKKFLGFSTFEFYFVVSVIGLVLIFGIQRYSKLAVETQRLSFEILAQNFSAAIYNHRARWILAQQTSDQSRHLVVDNVTIQFSSEGWPVAATSRGATEMAMSVASCLSLWNTFLKNPSPISFAGGHSYGSHKYHLELINNNCRFELLTDDLQGSYFEYSPITGQVNVILSSNTKTSR